MIFFSFGIFACYNLGGSALNAQTQNKQSIRYVVFHKPGPNWKQGVDFRQQVGVQSHVQHYLKLYEKGKLSLGGPFLDSTGGMMIPTKGTTLKEITTFAKSDPAVKSGLLVIEIRPWLIAMDKDRKP